jgi:hypothetical protein
MWTRQAAISFAVDLVDMAAKRDCYPECAEEAEERFYCNLANNRSRPRVSERALQTYRERDSY